MPLFAPVYPPTTSQQSFLTREQKRERKRKRDGDDHHGGDSENEGLDAQSAAPENDTLRIPHPVNRTDPYYVAGHPREKPLPGANFPHAAVKDLKHSEPSIQEELASLKPPLFVSKETTSSEDHAGSLKRRHLDNLTAILHKCMLEDDWQRASRVWGLILRTEVQGYGPDVRRNGHWLMGAELLMRRSQTVDQVQIPSQGSSSPNGDNSGPNVKALSSAPVISDEGFRQVRAYYDGLILQYPHRPRAPHNLVNALAIYPALFNVWVYEVQDQASRARQLVARAEQEPDHDVNSSPGASAASGSSETRKNLAQISATELEKAKPIAQRLDELMLSPPYDTSSELLHIRGMVGLWLCDLHNNLAKALGSGSSDSSSGDESIISRRSSESRVLKQRHRQHAKAERQIARRAFEKMLAANLQLPKYIHAFLEEDDEPTAPHDDDEGV